MITIRLNSELSLPLIFRFAQEGVHLEISPDIEGFIIEMPGEDNLTGTTRQEFMRALHEVRRKL